jgi:hypothetical protein
MEVGTIPKRIAPAEREKRGAMKTGENSIATPESSRHSKSTKKFNHLPPQIKTATATYTVMARVLETKACAACSMAKRRCGKQTPHCLRCRTRGIECTYPPPKPTQFVRCGEDDTLQVEPDFSPCNTLQVSEYSPSLQSQAAGTRQSFWPDFPGFSGSLIDDRLASSWFASVETWKVSYPEANQNPLSVPDLKRHIGQIRRWLTKWVEKGSNPFIHARLYRTRFPRCIQDAYAALSCYINKNEANEQNIFQIIETKATELVAKYSISSAESSQENGMNSIALDSLDHIARVHALMVYQFLGLYDGDIRLRHLSETYIPVLNRWMREMVQHTSQAACLGGSVISSTYEQTDADFGQSYIPHDQNLLWYAWIVAESVRRSWVIGAGIQVAFLVLQQGGAVPCQGGMMFTTRQGVWEAQSAVAWEKLCSERPVGLMHVAEADRLFTEAAAEEVNEFTKVVLEITFGKESMERWGAQVEY